MGKINDFSVSCPLPLQHYPNVLLAHGGGGKLMGQLIEQLFVPAFDNPMLLAQHDGALIEMGHGIRLAFSTDSYVVSPLFFPGGDIGTLAVNGTVNDLAMCGAKPLYLSAGFIIEEGFPMEALQQVVSSMQKTAAVAQVQIVTGDTKVVDKGKGDGLYINTAGVGLVNPKVNIGPDQVQTGDVVLLSGDIGRHGIAIMAQREGLAFETTIESDCASVAGLVQELLEADVQIHCMRDLTRGGLASALIEIAEKAQLQIEIEEQGIPMLEEVQGACEILGLDPLYVANEGRFVAFIPSSEAERALALMRAHPLGSEARIIGLAGPADFVGVTVKSRIGVPRVIDRLSGEQLPRIC